MDCICDLTLYEIYYKNINVYNDVTLKIYTIEEMKKIIEKSKKE